MTSEAPPSGRRGGFRVVSICAGILLAISALICAALTRAGLSFAHEVTCGGEPPVAWRQSVVYWGLGIYLAFALAALTLLVLGRRTSVIFSLVFAAAGICVSVVTFLIPVLASGLC